jgi:hypothetical protein
VLLFFGSAASPRHVPPGAAPRASRQRGRSLREVDVRRQPEAGTVEEEPVRSGHSGTVAGGDAGPGARRRQPGRIAGHPRTGETEEAAAVGGEELAFRPQGPEFDAVRRHRRRERQPAGDERWRPHARQPVEVAIRRQRGDDG